MIDRAKLAAILGMLGSEHAGERDAAAIAATAMLKRHGVTWAQVLAGGELKPSDPMRPYAGPTYTPYAPPSDEIFRQAQAAAFRAQQQNLRAQQEAFMRHIYEKGLGA